jgi:hypothetical protein
VPARSALWMAHVAALMVASTSCQWWRRSWARWRRWAQRISGNGPDVELAGVDAGGRAGPEPVAAAHGLVRRQAAGDGPGDAAAGGAAAAGRAQHPAERVGVAQVKAGVVPVEPGDPGQRLARGGREAFLLVVSAVAGVEDDRGGVVQSAGEFQEVQVVGVSEPADVVDVVLAGDRGDSPWQRSRR